VSDVTISARQAARSAVAVLEPDHRLWLDMLAHLRKNTPDICRQWFQELEPMGLDGGVLKLRAHSPIHRDYLQRQCQTQFSDAARSVSNMLLSVRFLGPEDDAPRPQPAGQPAQTKARAGEARQNDHAGNNRAAIADEILPSRPAADAEFLKRPGLVINPDYAFENFVIGPGNRVAHSAALAVSKNPGWAYNPYFVHGNVGLGKTHLLQAICLRIRQANPEASIYYTSCEDFMTQFLEAVQAGLMTQFRNKFRHVDVLVIDDIHFLSKRDRTQEEFFHTFNALYQAHKQIVLSSDAAPEDIPQLEDRLVSRFKCGLVCEIAPPCYETRVEILKTKSRLRGFDMPGDVASYIAGKIDANIRELEGAISKLQMLASVDNKPIDMELARAALNDHTDRVEPKIQIQTIIDSVTEFYGVKVTDLQSKRRQRSIALPRQVCMYLARRNTRYSLEEIGGYFGGRDHTTVMHAVRTIESRRESDTEFAQILQALEEKLRAPIG
jgi:chromosomal replication initiator protein